MSERKQRAKELIKLFEGFRSRPYLDSAGVPTIGYGTTKYANGKRVSLHDAPISEAAADLQLEEFCAREVFPLLDNHMLHLTDNEYAALCSFIYNVGRAAAEKSTLLAKVYEGRYDEAADEFPKWRFCGGRVNKGLVNRRAKEREVFLTGEYNES